MEKYEQLSVVGEGSYGIVMKCRHRETNQFVAVKKFLETEEDATIRKMALREIRMLKKLKHENLVTMIEVFRHKKRFYLVFEFLEGTILDELDKMPGGLGEERSRERIFQVVRAISYCHTNNIIHRDVKPENVLVSSLGVVKLCDFGFARLISLTGEACTEYVATRWYRAPELLVAEPCYGTGVDIWAIGCLFAEIMTGDPLFPGESDIDQFYLIVKMLGKPCVRHQQLMARNTELRSMIKISADEPVGLYEFFSSWSLSAVDFLSGCMKMDPQYRLSADDLLKHPYYTHDRFQMRFLPALREKVNVEFNNPLLRKFKTEIFMSTDKKDETRRKSIPGDSKWKFTLAEGSMKRKLVSDALIDSFNLNEKTPTKPTQRLSIAQRNNQNASIKQRNASKLLQNGSNAVEMQMLEKSLESLARFNTSTKTESVRPISAQKEGNTSLSPEPPPFQSLGDYKGNNGHAVLHPSVNNISFNKDVTRSPSLLQSLNCNSRASQIPLLNNSRVQFLRKTGRNVLVESMFATGDQVNQTWNNPSACFQTTNLCKRKEAKARTEELCLPNVPGAYTSNRPDKKTSLVVETPTPSEITPDYRYRRAKRKRNILDISLPFSVNEKG